jgi:hypothetical protein
VPLHWGVHTDSIQAMPWKWKAGIDPPEGTGGKGQHWPIRQFGRTGTEHSMEGACTNE